MNNSSMKGFEFHYSKLLVQGIACIGL